MTDFESVGVADPIAINLFGQETTVAAGAYIGTLGEIAPVEIPPSSAATPSEFEQGPGILLPPAENAFASVFVDPLDHWWEDMHVVPRTISFPNLLSAQSVSIEVHSAYRRVEETWSSFVNNAGAGVELLGEPSLPAVLEPMKTILGMTVEISTSGPANVDGTIDFVFSIAGTILVPVVLQRIVLFYVIPENDDEFIEELEFGTDVIPSLDGSEMRPSYRKRPRQFFEYDYRLFEIDEDGGERQKIQNMLFGWQSRTFGLPVWFFETFTTQIVSAGATSIQVDSTDYRDFRIGGYACVIVDEFTFDVLEIDSLTSSSITLVAPTINGYPVGTSVYPLRLAEGASSISGSRYPVNAMDTAIRFRVTENDVDLADVSAFSSFNSKVLFDDENGILGSTSREAFEQEDFNLDNRTGLVKRTSDWTRHKPVRDKTFFAKGFSDRWDLRQVVYALRGQQISFYLPTKKPDLEVLSDLVSSTNTMSVRNDGYTKFVASKQPRNVIRIVFVDGSPAILRTITSSSEVDVDEETLIVDSPWSSTITPAEIERVEFVEKMRFDSDSIRFRHQPGNRATYCTVPCRGVFD